MAAFLLLSVLLSGAAASGPYVLQTTTGEDATLRCQTDGNVSIIALEWTRTDLKTEEFVFFYRDEHPITSGQHSSYKNRVQLVDGELKDGDLSLILRNVSVSDNGTYECRVAVGGSRRKKRANITRAPIRIIQLVVTDSDSKNEAIMDGNHHHFGLAAVPGLVCFAVLGLVVGVVRKSKRHQDNNPEASADDERGPDPTGVELASLHHDAPAQHSAGEGSGSAHEPPPP
ncbi:junctional adhesion molecule-like [Symphorus nematophorus]